MGSGKEGIRGILQLWSLYDIQTNTLHQEPLGVGNIIDSMTGSWLKQGNSHHNGTDFFVRDSVCRRGEGVSK